MDSVVRIASPSELCAFSADLLGTAVARRLAITTMRATQTGALMAHSLDQLPINAVTVRVDFKFPVTRLVGHLKI